jgi:hypothetical protein
MGGFNPAHCQHINRHSNVTDGIFIMESIFEPIYSTPDDKRNINMKLKRVGDRYVVEECRWESPDDNETSGAISHDSVADSVCER